MLIYPKVGSENGTIKLENGENCFEYFLSSDGTPTGESVNIEVFFANKTLNRELKIDQGESDGGNVETYLLQDQNRD